MVKSPQVVGKIWKTSITMVMFPLLTGTALPSHCEVPPNLCLFINPPDYIHRRTTGGLVVDQLGC
jgi:hypothetical protein